MAERGRITIDAGHRATLREPAQMAPRAAGHVEHAACSGQRDQRCTQGEGAGEAFASEAGPELVWPGSSGPGLHGRRRRPAAAPPRQRPRGGDAARCHGAGPAGSGARWMARSAPAGWRWPRTRPARWRSTRRCRCPWVVEHAAQPHAQEAADLVAEGTRSRPASTGGTPKICAMVALVGGTVDSHSRPITAENR